MTNPKVLLAASTALALVSAGSPAFARTKDASKTSAIQQTLDAQKTEIDALKAQLETLQQQVAAEQGAQSQAQAAAAQAAQAASAAEDAKVAAAQAQTTASSAQAAVDKAKDGSAAFAKAASWAGDTKVSGRMYFNMSSISQKSDGVKTQQDGGFAIKRFYLGVDHKFNDMFSGNITTDVSHSSVGEELYVKKAFLQVKLDPAFIIRLGATDMPWIPYAEGMYGYRHVEQTLIDRTKFGTSSDWGVHVMGKLADGLISYQVSAVDGGGYRNPKFTKTIDLEGRLSLKYKGINAAIGGYTGKLGNDTQGATTYHTASRFNALLAYKTKMFTVGGEYFAASNFSKTNVTTTTTDKSDGFSLYGNVNFAPQWSAFGRYDWVKPNKDTVNNLKDQYFNIGVQYSPAKIVDLALVYKHDKAQNGTISTGNGTIGGTIDGTYDEIGLFGQFRF